LKCHHHLHLLVESKNDFVNQRFDEYHTKFWNGNN
jgi:hypothetical protein